MIIQFIEKDQFVYSETTIYWFWVDCKKYGLQDCSGDLDLVDCEGDHLKLDGHNIKVFEALIELYLNEV